MHHMTTTNASVSAATMRQVLALLDDCNLTSFEKTFIENLRFNCTLLFSKLDVAVAKGLACYLVHTDCDSYDLSAVFKVLLNVILRR